MTIVLFPLEQAVLGRTPVFLGCQSNHVSLLYLLLSQSIHMSGGHHIGVYFVIAIASTWYSAMPLKPLKTCCSAVGWTMELAFAGFVPSGMLEECGRRDVTEGSFCR